MATSGNQRPIIANEIDLVVNSRSHGNTNNHLLVYFVPGNPGLIGYYDDLLSRIRNLLNDDSLTNDKKQDTTFHIHGSSLTGFDVGTRSPTFKSLEGQHLPASLDEQTADVYAGLEDVVAKIACENDIQPDQLPVILIGHSIGAYMSLETISRWQKTTGDSKSRLKIAAGIGLFPTVFELSHSPMGKKVGPLTRIPHFALAIHLLAKTLFLFVPIAAVARVVQFVTSMPSNPAQVTASFLKSTHGVQQALHMAKDELAQLTHDTWSDEFWATTSVPESGFAKLYFYWGEEDHWVAASTRDKLIAARAGTGNNVQKPVMEIDRNGIPHAFCLSDEGNRIVAEKCAGWIRETEHRVFGAGKS